MVLARGVCGAQTGSADCTSTTQVLVSPQDPLTSQRQVEARGRGEALVDIAHEGEPLGGDVASVRLPLCEAMRLDVEVHDTRRATGGEYGEEEEEKEV